MYHSNKIGLKGRFFSCWKNKDCTFRYVQINEKIVLLLSSALKENASYPAIKIIFQKSGFSQVKSLL